MADTSITSLDETLTFAQSIFQKLESTNT